MWIERQAQNEIAELRTLFPAVALLGPRQCGKSSLARHIMSGDQSAILLDLDSPADLRKLDDAELFFEANRNVLVCLDEIQNCPDLFPVLRSEIDKDRRPGRFLILGSASQDLIRQSSESLAGRIAYHELTPFLFQEIGGGGDAMRKLWIRGGFPDAYLAPSDRAVSLWRKNFIMTFVKRDIPQLGFRIDSNRLVHLLTLLAHSQGQMLNAVKLAQFLEVSAQTVRNHLELLCNTFLLRSLPSYSVNVKKRVVKTPKIYFRDQGIPHQLLEINSFNDLLGHPMQGASWEGFSIEQICVVLPEASFYFYRTSNGAEIDLLIEYRKHHIAVEFKCSNAPKISRGFYSALEDLPVTEAWVIIPAQEEYCIKGVKVAGLEIFLKYLRELCIKVVSA